MHNHLDAYDKILADLRTLDVEIADEDETLYLLNSLPDQYDHLSTTQLYGKKIINYKEVESVMSNNSVQKQIYKIQKITHPQRLWQSGEGLKIRNLKTKASLDLNQEVHLLIEKLQNTNVTTARTKVIERGIVSH